MIKIVNYLEIDLKGLERLGGWSASESVEASVSSIIDDVRERGDAAVLDYTERFDGVRPDKLRVTEEEIQDAIRGLAPELHNAMRLAALNITKYHERQVRHGFLTTDKPGVVLGQRITPIERVGIYVPGGTASYPSTVLMNAIPARIAGVKHLVMCTPPGPDGKVNSAILAAAGLAGVNDVFAIGGAQAVAALAYGTQSVPKVYKIVGPGNVYVAAAKRKVYGLVDIDMIAGPSDVLVIADESAKPEYIAADMLAQAEHDTLSRAVLVTDSPSLAQAVCAEIERQLELLPRREIAGAAMENGGLIVVTEGLEQAVQVSNLIAPEHLEIMTGEPFSLLGQITNAGSIFLGEHAAEALGDYLAGPNHTLPTMGTAKFSSPLSVDDFTKKSSITYYSKEALKEVAGDTASFARAERLEGHARSAEIRFGGGNN